MIRDMMIKKKIVMLVVITAMAQNKLQNRLGSCYTTLYYLSPSSISP